MFGLSLLFAIFKNGKRVRTHEEFLLKNQIYNSIVKKNFKVL